MIHKLLKFLLRYVKPEQSGYWCRDCKRSAMVLKGDKIIRQCDCKCPIVFSMFAVARGTSRIYAK